MTKRLRVVCFQQRLVHYRESFFEMVRDELGKRGVDFVLVYGRPDEIAKQKNDSGHLPWAIEVTNKIFHVGPYTLVWQPVPKEIGKPDLVIVTQENKLLANYIWLLKRTIYGCKVAFWGHGRNFQTDRPNGFLERIKTIMVTKVDWWFAYTDRTKKILLEDGFPAERISVLDNAIDNDKFASDLSSVTSSRLTDLRRELGIAESAPVGLFCGSLYKDKRLDFMISAAEKVRESLPDFHLIVVGDGPAAAEIRDAAASRPWLHPVGARKGMEKVAFFRMASIIFNPGAVGLHVLDSFCAGVPMATTTESRHGPEIAYLEHGQNCLIVSGSSDNYAKVVTNLLSDPIAYERMRQRAYADAKRYSLSNMVEHFVDGVACCLSLSTKS